jgi:hypothetical protein
VKPNLFRRNGRWHCEAEEGTTGSGVTAGAAYQDWLMGRVRQALTRRALDFHEKERFTRPDPQKQLPQYWPPQYWQPNSVPRVRGYWEDFPPGTLICQSKSGGAH